MCTAVHTVHKTRMATAVSSAVAGSEAIAAAFKAGHSWGIVRAKCGTHSGTEVVHKEALSVLQ
jgi:hypothetical protein